LLINAAGCYIRLHGYGLPLSLVMGPESFYAVEINGIQQLNVTPPLGELRGFHSYIVDPSTCSASDYQNFDLFTHASESPRLVDYLQALKNGK